MEEVSMCRFISIIGATALLVTFLVITTKNSGAENIFITGPNGNSFSLIDCSIPANNSDPEKCANTSNPTGAISWESSRERAQAMTFEGYSCDLASPSTKKLNDFLKGFPGFLDACNDCGQVFQLCPWFGARDPSLTEPPGPYQFVNDPFNDVPCPFATCDPIVDPGIDTALTFQDWCRVSNGCLANEPNGPALQDGQFYLVYLRYLTAQEPVAWADCQNSKCPSQSCQPTSYFVECEVPFGITGFNGGNVKTKMIKNRLNGISVSDAPPNKRIAFYYGFNKGKFTLNGGKCDGTKLDIKPASLLAFIKTNGAGNINNKHIYIPPVGGG